MRARLDAIDTELAELDNRPPKFAPEDMARGGVLLRINGDGRLQVEYGLLRPEDAPSANGADDDGEDVDDTAAHDNEAGPGAQASSGDDDHEHWQTKLPEDPRNLWPALVELDRQGSLGALFSHCACLTVNAVREPHQPRRDALRHADTLAAALSLDMTATGWVTTADNYLARVTKTQILEAVREGKGENAVQLIEHLKKGDMAREAERLLQGAGWLPGPLRSAWP